MNNSKPARPLISHYFNQLLDDDSKTALNFLLKEIPDEKRYISFDKYFSLMGYGERSLKKHAGSPADFPTDTLVLPLLITDSDLFLTFSGDSFNDDDTPIDEHLQFLYFGLVLTKDHHLYIVSGFIFDSEIVYSLYEPAPNSKLILDKKFTRFNFLANSFIPLMSLIEEKGVEVYEFVNLFYQKYLYYRRIYATQTYNDKEEIELILNSNYLPSVASSNIADALHTVPITVKPQKDCYFITHNNKTICAKFVEANLVPVENSSYGYRIRSKITLCNDFDIIIFKVHEPNRSYLYHYICLTNPHDFKRVPSEDSVNNSKRMPLILNPTIQFNKQEDGSFVFAPKGLSRTHTQLNYQSLEDTQLFE